MVCVLAMTSRQYFSPDKVPVRAIDFLGSVFCHTWEMDDLDLTMLCRTRRRAESQITHSGLVFFSPLAELSRFFFLVLRGQTQIILGEKVQC